MFETFTKYGLLRFDRFDDAVAASIGEVITQPGQPWYWHREANGKWELYELSPQAQGLVA